MGSSPFEQKQFCTVEGGGRFRTKVWDCVVSPTSASRDELISQNTLPVQPGPSSSEYWVAFDILCSVASGNSPFLMPVKITCYIPLRPPVQELSVANLRSIDARFSFLIRPVCSRIADKTNTCFLMLLELVAR